MPVSRFSRLAGIPERTYRRRLARHRAGDPSTGPWPAPKVDDIEATAAKYAVDWPAWGHRKIAAMMRADGHEVSTSTVQRALRRRGLLLPKGFRADRKSWALLRKKVFHAPPTARNRVWQTDFSGDWNRAPATVTHSPLAVGARLTYPGDLAPRVDSLSGMGVSAWVPDRSGRHQ